MEPDVLALLRDPVTHDPLEIGTELDTRGRRQEFLVNPRTGQRFIIREGIPVFLRDAQVSGENKRYQAMYDRLAPFYDFSTWVYSRWKGVSVEARLREYLDELEVRAGDSVLEVSVGTGRNLRFLPHTARYFGLDISWGMLARSRRHAAKWKLDLTLFMGMAECLPFRDESFDVVFHFGGINFFNDRAAAIYEMVRVAKPGTKFVIGDETEEFAQKHQNVAVAGSFYGNRTQAISAPVDLLPAGMKEVRVREIAGGDLYCLSFRKPH